MIRKLYKIEGDLYKEALNYAEASKGYTSNRHDFHMGGLSNKKEKMFNGKLGEKAVKLFFIDNNINFIEDCTSYKERDEYDFLLINEKNKIKVDVKTRTEDFHIRTLEMVEQAKTHPKDIYISVRLFKPNNSVKLLGWYTYDDMIKANHIENQGYLNNYVMYDEELRSIKELENMLNEFKK